MFPLKNIFDQFAKKGFQNKKEAKLPTYKNDNIIKANLKKSNEHLQQVAYKILEKIISEQTFDLLRDQKAEKQILNLNILTLQNIDIEIPCLQHLK